MKACTPPIGGPTCRYMAIAMAHRNTKTCNTCHVLSTYCPARFKYYKHAELDRVSETSINGITRRIEAKFQLPIAQTEAGGNNSLSHIETASLRYMAAINYAKLKQPVSWPLGPTRPTEDRSSLPYLTVSKIWCLLQ